MNEGMKEAIDRDRDKFVNRIYEAAFSIPGVDHVGPDQPTKKRLEQIRRAVEILEESYGRA